jgi:hypothetical protein
MWVTESSEECALEETQKRINFLKFTDGDGG